MTKGKTFKLIIALYALLLKDPNVRLDHYNINHTFIKGLIDIDQIYMEPPRRYEQYDDNGNLLYWLLKKSLYGLKQAGCIWNETFTKELLAAGMTQSKVDLCLFYKFTEDYFILVTVYVDDMTSLTNSEIFQDSIFIPLKSKIKLKHMDTAQWLLAHEIIVDKIKRIVALSQRKYVLEILVKFRFESVKPSNTPIKKGELSNAVQKPFDQKKYQEATGCLTYLATSSQLDIAYTISRASSFNSNPMLENWHMVRKFSVIFKR